jgi:hypothetical protein
MNLRRHLAVLSLASVALVACGDDETPATATEPPGDVDAPTDTEPPPDTEGPTDTAAPDTAGDDGSAEDAYAHPTGADEAIISVAELGGFTTARYAFAASPRLIIAGDGTVYSPAMTAAVFPGPLVTPMQVQTISEEGIQAVLAAADEAGLFAEVDYEDESSQLIADAPTTVVTISVDGETWTHSAYALGFEDLSDDAEGPSPERQALQTFVGEVSGAIPVAGEDDLGEPESLQPQAYEVVATPVDDPSSMAVDDLQPTVVEWPSDTGVALADLGSCTRLEAADVGAVFESADELTLFQDGEIVYEVWVRPALPGRTCES